jgi:hypothetical protein
VNTAGMRWPHEASPNALGQDYLPYKCPCKRVVFWELLFKAETTKNDKFEEPLLPLGVAVLNSVGEFSFAVVSQKSPRSD